MSDLVKRRIRQTRAEIVDVAIPLFRERGFDNVAMSDIAQAAGVSRRTLFRYFATKDDLVFEFPRRWLEVLDATLATRAATESTRDVWRRAILDVAEFIRDDAHHVLAAFEVLSASPTLAARHGRSDAEWVARYVELIGPDVADDPDGFLLATTAAMTLVAATNAIIIAWAAGQPDADLIAMTHTVIDRTDCVWPDQSR